MQQANDIQHIPQLPTLTVHKRILVDHISTPLHQRKYKTYAELARALGVSERTLYDWKRAPEVKAALIAGAYEWSQTELPKVIHALFNAAQQPSGDRDRQTIVRYYIPGQLKAEDDGVISSRLATTSDKSNSLDEYTFNYIFMNVPHEMQPVIREIWIKANEDYSSLREDVEYVDVRMEDDDIIDLPQLPAAPGRPRGSRKVRLKRQQE